MGSVSNQNCCNRFRFKEKVEKHCSRQSSQLRWRLSQGREGAIPWNKVKSTSQPYMVNGHLCWTITTEILVLQHHITNVHGWNYTRSHVDWGGCSRPLESGKAIIFWTNAKFSFFGGQKPAAKDENKFFLYILNQKRNILRLVRWSAWNPGFLLKNYSVGWVKQSNYAG